MSPPQPTTHAHAHTFLADALSHVGFCAPAFGVFPVCRPTATSDRECAECEKGKYTDTKNQERCGRKSWCDSDE